MKAILIFLSMAIFNYGATAFANHEDLRSCNLLQGGGDAWPWSVAQPFPWDNIEGYWALGKRQSTFIRAHVLSSTKNRKILSLSIHKDSICSKPYAKGMGYIDINEINVVRALVIADNLKFQLKIAMFDSHDVAGLSGCEQNIVGLSMQTVGRYNNLKISNPVLGGPNPAAIQNAVLKKVPPEALSDCGNN